MRTERAAWYRDPSYAGNMTEAEKRKLDAFRAQGHPAVKCGDLPDEVQSYIARLEVQLYDHKQEKIVGRSILISAVGAVAIYLTYAGFLRMSPWSYIIGTIILVLPWFWYVREWKKNAKEFCPDNVVEEGSPVDVALRQEWDIHHISGNRLD